VAGHKDILSKPELDDGYRCVCEAAHALSVPVTDVNLEKLRPLLSRIASDLQTYPTVPVQIHKLELAASGAGILWARTSQVLSLQFEDAYKLADVVSKHFSSKRGGKQDSLLGSQNRSCEEISSVFGSSTEIYFSTFLMTLSKEWLRLEILPYHKKLRESNRFILQEKRRYYTIFNRMSEPAFIVDQDFHILETNKAFNHFFQLSGKDYIGRSCREVLGNEFCTLCALDNVLGKQTSSFGRQAEITVNGKCRHLVVTGSFLGDINSDVSGGIIILQDITESKKTADALRESEEKYRSLIENVPDVTWRSDPEGRLSYISPNIGAVCAYRPDTFCGAEAVDKFAMVHPDDVDMVRNAFGLFFASQLPDGIFLRTLFGISPEVLLGEGMDSGRKKYDVTYRFLKGDGSWIWLHDRASVIYEQDGNWYTDGVFSDVTELKEAEQELEKHHFRLAELVDERTVELRMVNKNLKKEISFRKHAEKDLLRLASKLSMSNKELEQFAHVASHDLKEPLMLIKAFSEKLMTRYANAFDERGREYLNSIVSASDRMSQLVDGFLALSRISSVEQNYEEIDLSELFEEVIENLAERIREVNGTVDFTGYERVRGDRIQLRQLFQNIIANALKFCKTGDNPTVKVSSSLISGNRIEITFEDDGIGFEPCHEERIFRPLERLHSRNEFDGTGMGLATCQKIVVRHGGEIEAKGQPGVGATFIVRLPVEEKHLPPQKKRKITRDNKTFPS